MVRLASLEYRPLYVGRQECEPQDVAIVGRGWCSFHRWQPAVSGEHGVGFAQRGDQNPIHLRRADLSRNHKVTTTASQQDDRQENDDLVGRAIKDELVVSKPGYDVGAVSGAERDLQPAIAEVDGSYHRKRIVGPQRPALDRLGDNLLDLGRRQPLNDIWIGSPQPLLQ